MQRQSDVAQFVNDIKDPHFFIYNLGIIAKKCLDQSGRLSSYLIETLMQRILNLTPDAKKISNTLIGLGWIVKNSKWLESLDNKMLYKFLQRLAELKKTAKPQEISNSLYALGLIAEADILDGIKLDALDINNLLQIIAKQKNLNYLDYQQCLFAVGRLMSRNPGLAIDPACVKLLASKVMEMMRNFIHPVNAAKLLESIIILSDFYSELATIVDKLIDAIRPLYAFPLHLHDTLNSSLSLLKEKYPDKHELLSQKLFPGAVQARACLDENQIQQASAANIKDAGSEAGTVRADVSSGGTKIRLTRTRTQQQSTSAPQASSVLRQQTQAQPQVQPAVSCHSTEAVTVESVSRRVLAKARNQEIFNLIENQNLRGLEELLKIKLPFITDFPVSHYSSAPAKNPAVSRLRSGVQRKTEKLEKQKVAYDLIIAFLQNTDEKALRYLITNSRQSYFLLLMLACSAAQRFELARNDLLYPVLLNLPIKELGLFMKNLQGSKGSLYKDHRATMKIIDALVIRVHDEPKNENVIRKLINEYKEEAIRHHTVRRNHHVLERLKFHEKEKEFQMRDFDAEEFPVHEHKILGAGSPVASSADVTFFSPTRSSTARPPLGRTQTTTITTTKTTTPVNDRLQQTQTPANTQTAPTAPPAPAGPVMINKHYQYDSEDMNAILNARIDDEKQGLIRQRLGLSNDVGILGGARLQGNTVAGITTNRPVDMLQIFLEANRHIYEKMVVVLPIEIHHSHWVGLMLTIENNKISSANYYNSSQNSEINDDEVIGTLFDTFLAGDLLRDAEVQINNQSFERQCLKQPDSTSCGPLTIENLLWGLTGNAWGERSDLIRDVRFRHLEVLAKNNAAYRSNFYDKQVNNVNAVQSLPQVMHRAEQFLQGSDNIPRRRL